MSKLERRETRRYLEMFYNLKFRNLVSVLSFPILLMNQIALGMSGLLFAMIRQFIDDQVVLFTWLESGLRNLYFCVCVCTRARTCIMASMVELLG